ncbi:hypothetical protein GCM10007301_12550 [Azorhizobium oxalatiphilum]|uniref:DUF924 family protein n=1 Tax=Azorhizobium oxalatiphilum TaxID=980631 RepID=A0A917F6Z9_9HYPH|nr:DUF924 family protein [Azorhizobium oxalatiphilum]GGF54495.1 hypothetical protein GCM10007301_12550 [Azorhizobium oxalatiphilum]
MTVTASDVITFWREAGPERWFTRDDAFDAAFRARFLDAHLDAARRTLDPWAQTPEGALALLILLDQFPRNAFRGTAHMYATDPLARAHADAAIARGFDKEVEPALRPFFYLPFEHSEDMADQHRCVALCAALGGITHEYAELHRDVIQRFGRFPHRNPLLGRPTTPEEHAFLADGGFAG